MPNIKGFIQNLQISPSSYFACVWIGPAPDNTALLAVQRRSTDTAVEDAYRSALVEALATAMMTHREVVAEYESETSSQITLITIQGS